MSSTAGPTLGPCASWIDSSEAQAGCPPLGAGSTVDWATFAVEASMVLYEVSGRQFPGVCTATVRPCQTAGCWGGRDSSGLWAWSSLPGGWGWYDRDGGRSCGCAPLSRIKLAGYPVRRILAVMIDGQTLPAVTAGVANYRLDGWRWLVRTDDPGPPQVPRYWPSCQNLALDATQPGTFEVSYEWGALPPPLGKAAAAALAQQLARQCVGGACQIPAGATRVQRQGVTVDRELLANWADPTKQVGIPAIDAFLAAYWRGGRGGRRPAVWSPDVARYPLRVT